ncbi:MAG: NUDIX hydrolase [Saprospiraceae bacterium]|nr:NUDIX hydrolase [Saprospiraceae bacterium]
MANPIDRSIINISVDCVIFGFDENEIDLKVLLIERGEEPFFGQMALPGDLVNIDENIDESAKRVLRELTGLDDIFLEQLFTFGNITRHPLGRVVTVTYYALIKPSDFDLLPSGFATMAEWRSISEIRELAFDHFKILSTALTRLKGKIRYQPIGFNLLPEKFTLTQLQSLYETILDTDFDKRNFRKKILSMDMLIPLNEKQKGVAHRAARLYKFDMERYDKLQTLGFNFAL